MDESTIHLFLHILIKQSLLNVEKISFEFLIKLIDHRETYN